MAHQDEKEVVPGYVEAWRWWRIMFAPTDSGGIALPRSDGKNTCWDWEDENVAEVENVAYNPLTGEILWDNRIRLRRAPTIENSCGFYAYKPEFIANHPSCHLFGRVALYGDVVEHEFGYRAEKARILDVWMNSTAQPSSVEEILSYPQVKGTFTRSPAVIYNQSGELETYICLTLESRKELRGTNLSGGQKTCLLINRSRQNGSQRTTPRENLDQANLISYQSLDHNLIKPPTRVCFYCGRCIMPGEAVKAEFFWPKLWEKKVEWSHLECVDDLSFYLWDYSGKYYYTNAQVIPTLNMPKMPNGVISYSYLDKLSKAIDQITSASILI